MRLISNELNVFVVHKNDRFSVHITHKIHNFPLTIRYVIDILPLRPFFFLRVKIAYDFDNFKYIYNQTERDSFRFQNYEKFSTERK